jgi:hypothetical protein
MMVVSFTATLLLIAFCAKISIFVFIETVNFLIEIEILIGPMMKVQLVRRPLALEVLM